LKIEDALLQYFSPFSFAIPFVLISEQLSTAIDDKLAHNGKIVFLGPLKKHGESTTVVSLLIYLLHNVSESTSHVNGVVKEGIHNPPSSISNHSHPLSHVFSEICVEHASQLNHPKFPLLSPSWYA
jgi:hypothetical protein